MRFVTAAIAALLYIALSFTGSAVSAGSVSCANAVSITADASVQADGSADAGAFIKPDVAPPSLTERSQESPGAMTGSVARDRRGSVPFSPNSLRSIAPPPPSASVRCAHLQVYRL